MKLDMNAATVELLKRHPDFTTRLCKLLNDQQRDHKQIMEFITHQTYPLKAIRVEQLLAIAAEKGPDGFADIFDMFGGQRLDIKKALAHMQKSMIDLGVEDYVQRTIADRQAAAKTADPGFPRSSCCKASVAQTTGGVDGPQTQTCMKCGEPCQLAPRTDAPPVPAGATRIEISDSEPGS